MTPELWVEIDGVVTAALALDEERRAAYVAERCAGQPALLAEVESLLASHRQAGDFMEADAWTESDHSESALAGLSIGGRAGPYLLVREIGRGGMGTVFLGDRDDGQFRKQVAIKLINTGAANAEILRRFRAERQILARLEHPNIARLLDGGRAENGLPYIAMEFVEGLPIQEYCAQGHLSLRQKLALFRCVCSAVHFAHQNLVVHRDIKPGNILVTSEGVPKLLDFGIAKILSATEAEPREAATEPLLRAMTLDYASPEQLRGLPITTASDIYSLGVLLYELLAGRKPYVLAEKTLDEVLRLVCVAEPDSPASANRELEGDLDAIVLKAMHKEPAQRYASSEELSADLGRYLAGQPVVARHASLRYVAGKYMARHRSRAAVLATGIVLLIAGAGAVVWEARIANRERAKAQRRFDDLRKLASVMVFDVNGNLAKFPGTTEARKLLVTKGLEYLDALAKESAGEPGLQRGVGVAYIRMGDIQGNIALANLGDLNAAIASYQKAGRILASVLATAPSDLDARFSLVDAYRDLSSSYAAARNEGESLRAARDAVAAAETAARANPANVRARRAKASAYFALAVALKRGEQAIEVWQKCLDIYLSLLRDKPDGDEELRNAALCHKYMATQFTERSMIDKALDHSRQAEELDSKRVAAQPSSRVAQLDLAFDLGSTAADYKALGHLDEALDRYRRSLAIRRQLADTDPTDARLQDRLLYAELMVGDTLLKQGKASAAVEQFLAAAAIGNAQNARSNATVGLLSNLAWVEGGLGQAWAQLGRKSESCSAYRRALAIHADLARRGVTNENERKDAAAWAAQAAECATEH